MMADGRQARRRLEGVAWERAAAYHGIPMAAARRAARVKRMWGAETALYDHALRAFLSICHTFRDDRHPGGAASFPRYAAYWTRRIMWERYFRLGRSRRRLLSLDAPVAGRRGRPTPLGDLIPAPGPPEPSDAADGIFAEVERLLDPRRAAILRLRHVDGLSNKDAGAVLGISRERVRQLDESALETLRRRL